jgi:hypothetical protein
MTYSVSVVLHGSVRAEVAHRERGQNGLLGPVILVRRPKLIYKTLSLQVRSEVVRDEVVIVFVHLKGQQVAS